MRVTRRLLLCIKRLGVYAGISFSTVIPVANAQSVPAPVFEVAELPIADAQKAMTDGRVSSKQLVQAYLSRIEAFDHRGPRLNALITLNPNALREPEALDRERAARGRAARCTGFR